MRHPGHEYVYVEGRGETFFSSAYRARTLRGARGRGGGRDVCVCVGRLRERFRAGWF